MKFNSIQSLLQYMKEKAENESVAFEQGMLKKTTDLLRRFPNSITKLHPQFRVGHYAFSSFVINSMAISMSIFDYDASLVFKVHYGDLERDSNTNADGVYKFEYEVYKIDSKISSNDEYMELMKEHGNKPKYDEMNDAWDYHRKYRHSVEKHQSKQSEIVRKINDYRVISDKPLFFNNNESYEVLEEQANGDKMELLLYSIKFNTKVRAYIKVETYNKTKSYKA